MHLYAGASYNYTLVKSEHNYLSGEVHATAHERD